VELVAVVVGITAGVIALVGRIPDPRRVKRELARVRVQSVESLVDGAAAAVRGTVALLAPNAYVTAPWTQQRCVYWLIIFEEVGVGGDSRELGRIDDGTPFLLRSDHGTARVVPDRPRLAVHGQSFMRPMYLAHDILQVARGAKLKRPNYRTSWVRMTVYALAPDTFVTISGWCTHEPDPEATTDVAGYREQLPTRPVISGTRRAKLLIG